MNVKAIASKTKKSIGTFLLAAKFWAAQSTVEVFVVLTLSYAGVDLMNDFCSKCLFVENFEGVIWGVGLKFLLFLFPYLAIYFILNQIIFLRNLLNRLASPGLNLITSSVIIVVINTIRGNDVLDMWGPLLATVTSSVIVGVLISIKNKEDGMTKMQP